MQRVSRLSTARTCTHGTCKHAARCHAVKTAPLLPQLNAHRCPKVPCHSQVPIWREDGDGAVARGGKKAGVV